MRDEGGGAVEFDQKSLPLDDPAAHADSKCPPRCEDAGLPLHGPLFSGKPARRYHVWLFASYVADSL